MNEAGCEDEAKNLFCKRAKISRFIRVVLVNDLLLG